MRDDAGPVRDLSAARASHEPSQLAARNLNALGAEAYAFVFVAVAVASDASVIFWSVIFRASADSCAP